MPSSTSRKRLKRFASSSVTRFSFLLTYIALCASPLCAETRVQWGHGPIEVDNQYPLARLHLSAAPFSPAIDDAGTLRLSSAFTWSSTFNVNKSHYRVDAEHRVLELGLAYSLNGETEIGIHIPLEYRGGGILDSTIDNWHQFFGFPRGGRDNVRNDEFVIQGVNKDQSEFSFRDDGTQIGNVRLHAKHLFTRGTNTSPAQSLVVRMTLPTGNRRFSSEGVDVLLGYAASKRFGDFIAYGNAAYLFISDRETNNLRFKRNQASASLSLEYEVTSEASLLIGTTYYSNLLKQVENFPDYQLYLDFGIAYSFSDEISTELLVRENPAPRLGSTDVSATLGMHIEFQT